MKRTRRKQTNTVLGGGRCTLCGGALMLVTSQRVRGWAAWLNPLWNPEVAVFEVCEACGARVEVYQRDAAR